MKKEGFVCRWLAFEVTRRCNLFCVHCRSTSSLASPESDFSLEETKVLIDDLSDYGEMTFVLSGGEPLLRPDIFDIAEYGNFKKLKVCLATNGTLLDDEKCREIKKTGIKMVSLSLDGSSPECHDTFRNQKGSFEKVLSGIALLKRHEIPFLINSSFTKNNRDEIEKTYELMKKINPVAWYMFLIVPTGRAEGSEDLLNKEEYERILLWHYSKEKEERNFLIRPTCAPSYYRISLQEARKEAVKLNRKSLLFGTGGGKGCVCAQTICFIDYQGNVQPCSYFPIFAGNVKKTKFREIWENSELFRSLRNFSAYEGNCSGCEYISVCGGCRARAYYNSGNYMDRDPYCDYKKGK